MKKAILILLCLLLAGCHTAPAPETQPATVPVTEPVTEPETTPETIVFTTPVYENILLGNPWEDYASLEEAEAACGLDLPLEDVVAGSYQAETYRVLNGELLEVTYRDESFEVTVRMKAGEDDDISGVYAEYSEIHTFEEEAYTVTLKYIQGGGILQLISKDGCSYSFYAPNNYWGDSSADFLAFLNQ